MYGMEQNKNLLKDVPTETLMSKLRRSNGMMHEVITAELIYRAIFKQDLKLDNGIERPIIQYIDPINTENKPRPRPEDFEHCEKEWLDTPDGEKMYYIPEYLKAIEEWEKENYK